MLGIEIAMRCYHREHCSGCEADKQCDRFRDLYADIINVKCAICIPNPYAVLTRLVTNEHDSEEWQNLIALMIKDYGD